MALIIAPSQPGIHDAAHEVHTVTVDTIDQTNKTDFIAHLPTPLENVVQAQLIAATLTTTGGLTQTAFHIGIEELRSYFSQRAKKDLDASTDNHLNGVFGTIVGQHVLIGPSQTPKVMVFKNDYPIIQVYHNPIRKLDRLTFNIDEQNGDTATVVNAMFILKITCRKKNLA